MTLAAAHRRLAHLVETFDEAGLLVEDARLQEDGLVGDEYAQVQLTVAIPLAEHVGLTAIPGSDPQSIYGDKTVDVDDADASDAGEGADADNADQLTDDAVDEDDAADSLDHTDEDDLRQAYEESESIAEAAEHFEVGYSAVFKRMKRHGIHDSDSGSGSDDGDDQDSDAGETDEHRIGDELEDDVDQEASADCGAVDTQTSTGDLPGDVTEADVDEVLDDLEDMPYLGTIADELDVEEDRARTLLVKAGRYGDVIDATESKFRGDS